MVYIVEHIYINYYMILPVFGPLPLPLPHPLPLPLPRYYY